MYYSIEYFYSDGKKKIPIATLMFDGKNISYKILFCRDKIDLPNFDSANLDEYIRHMIRLPLIRSELRSKTLPYFFKKIQPNTFEHFQNIPHNTTYFKFSPILRREFSNSSNTRMQKKVV